MQEMYEIQADLQKFKSDLFCLSDQLGEAQKNITLQGLIPRRALIEEIEKLLVNFQVLRNDLRSKTSELGLMPDDPGVNPASLGDLEEILQKCLQASADNESEVSAAAVKIAQVLGLQHVDDGNFSPLDGARLECEHLLHKFRTSSALRKDRGFLEEASPVLALHELCSLWETIEDQYCEELRSKVADRFNNTLAMAASRGKIKFGAVPPEIVLPAIESEESVLSPITPLQEDPVPLQPSSNPFPWQK